MVGAARLYSHHEVRQLVCHCSDRSIASCSCSLGPANGRQMYQTRVSALLFRCKLARDACQQRFPSCMYEVHSRPATRPTPRLPPLACRSTGALDQCPLGASRYPGIAVCWCTDLVQPKQRKVARIQKIRDWIVICLVQRGFECSLILVCIVVIDTNHRSKHKEGRKPKPKSKKNKFVLS